MFLIVSLTAAIGFIASFLLLRAGIGAMWLRYPSAVLVAYLGFLFLLWVWLRMRESDTLEIIPRAVEARSEYGVGSASTPAD